MATKIAKSFHKNTDKITEYCSKHTIKMTPLQMELFDSTLANHELYFMIGAPEVLQTAQNFIRLIKAKQVLDIGTFTGYSALSAAIALPEDGKVISMDVNHDALNRVGLPIINKDPIVKAKIDFKLGSAVDTLDELIINGQSGTFDYAFIDADKENYSNYYNKSLQLLRPGGVIIIDNALWRGLVTGEELDEATQAIHDCNKIVSEDPKTDSMLINCGDGLHIAFKL